MARPWSLVGDRPKLSENDVELQCLDVLRHHHFYPLRQQSGLFIPAERQVIAALRQAGVRFRVITIGEPGIPDYAIPQFFVEVKRPGAKASPDQEKKIFELSKSDLETALIDNVESLIDWLKQHQKY